MQAPKTKQYVIVLAAGQNLAQFSPQTPARLHLTIQNTGAQNGQIRFENQVQGDGGDLLFLPGQVMIWDHPDTCPREAINAQSDNGTTFAIIEVTQQ